jgi:uncharacterized protein
MHFLNKKMNLNTPNRLLALISLRDVSSNKGGVMKRTSWARWLVGAAFLGLTLSAHAASFDCSAAKARVDRAICADRTLDKLDGDLGTAYQKTLDLAADQPDLLFSQREWLTERNKCADNRCLAQRYRERLAALQQVKPAGWKTWHDAKLGFSFEYLANRQVKTCSVDGSRQCVQLVGRNMGSSDFLISFKRVDGPFEKVANDEAGFEKNDEGKWVTSYGPGVPTDVERFSGNGWRGMRATISCGIQDAETGFHAAGGDCFWAVVNNGRYSVVASTEGILGTDDATMHSVDSIRFDR